MKKKHTRDQQKSRPYDMQQQSIGPKNRRFRNDHEYNCQIEWYMENLLKIDISMEKLIS